MISRSISGALPWLAVVVSASAQVAPPPLDTILDRMTLARAANQTLLKPYVVTRLYVLVGKNEDNKKSEVTAEVSFVPPHSKTYSIKGNEGSGLGERIVRRMLDGETKIVKDYGATDLTTANYDFQMVGEEELEGKRCYVIGLDPKRRDKTLLRGNIWIDAETYRIHRVEATPAKSPSWWLRDVRVAFSYDSVDGMWLQTSSEFSTNVRIFGRHTMTSHDVNYEPG
ncbi:MAG: outer membrane lipoprotein-sorting protein [Acidobacteria bacterium]|nr:outer membrane lipoprotein-sorting protein [Acidobacteriota bacterium]MDA1236309.1 outer membrane lipoprotein-sorting protein [Acidobacteriota bacterium]